MPFVISAIVLVGVLGAVNLLLMFGVIRRLREQTASLEQIMSRPGGPVLDVLPKVGDPVADFAGTTVDGQPLAREDLLEGTVVVFLAADCGTCHDKLPELVSWAADQDRRRVVAIVDAQLSDPADLVDSLNPVAQVIVEGAGARIGVAFQVSSFPAFCVIGGDGDIAAVHTDYAQLPATTAS